MTSKRYTPIFQTGESCIISSPTRVIPLFAPGLFCDGLLLLQKLGEAKVSTLERDLHLDARNARNILDQLTVWGFAVSSKSAQRYIWRPTEDGLKAVIFRNKGATE